MGERIKIFPWFLILNIVLGLLGFNTGVFIARYIFSFAGLVAGIMIGWAVGWAVSTFVIAAFIVILKSTGSFFRTSAQFWSLLGITISWSIFWTTTPALILKELNLIGIFIIIGMFVFYLLFNG